MSMQLILRMYATGGVALMVLMVFTSGCSSSSSPVNLGAVVEPDALARLLDGRADHGVVVLDVRDEAAYEQGHVAGAVRVDSAVWKDESLVAETGLDHESLWRSRIAELGVSGREPVVIYDDGRMTEAARVWFIFQHFGVPQAGVLNGGYPSLESSIAQGRIAISREPSVPKPTRFTPAAAQTATVDLADREDVRQSVEHGRAQIFDTRTREEYLGRDLRKNTRGGRIPTAINLPHKELLDDQGRLKSPEELAELFERAGFQRGRPVITHCDGGGRASLAALAAQRAGYGPVLNYYLSFGDWAADATCPIERPDQ